VTELGAGRPRFDFRQEQEKDFIPWTPRLNLLWGPLSLLSERVTGTLLFLRGVKLTTHFYLGPGLRMRGDTPPPSHAIHGSVLYLAVTKVYGQTQTQTQGRNFEVKLTLKIVTYSCTQLQQWGCKPSPGKDKQISK